MTILGRGRESERQCGPAPKLCCFPSKGGLAMSLHLHGQSQDKSSTQVVLEVHGWHTQCGACGYGRGGWAGSPALEDKPILTPRSKTCHGCGATFTHVLDVYRDRAPRPINRRRNA